MTSRVNLSEQDLQSAIAADAAYEEKIPILKRRAEAKDAGAPKDPICVIVVGMAGSGKTTLMAQLQKSLGLQGREEDGRKDVSYAAFVQWCIYVCYLLKNLQVII
jgi:pantothenate kinase-related protein Tda10